MSQRYPKVVLPIKKRDQKRARKQNPCPKSAQSKSQDKTANPLKRRWVEEFTNQSPTNKRKRLFIDIAEL